MNNITVSAVSKDGTRVLITPFGETSRGVWVDLGTSLEGITFPEPAVTPKIQLAPWGSGKGVTGGFSSLRGRP
jgi:hypothetical protein